MVAEDGPVPDDELPPALHDDAGVDHAAGPETDRPVLGDQELGGRADIAERPEGHVAVPEPEPAQSEPPPHHAAPPFQEPEIAEMDPIGQHRG